MTPYRKIFQNSVPKGFIATLINVLSSSFMKVGQQEIGIVMRYLPDKKNFGWLSSSRYCVDRAQNLPGSDPKNVLRVLQISCKSVYFRRSYIQTREHHQIALQSESNIRLKPSFESNN